jgi:hypothetical protein
MLNYTHTYTKGVRFLAAERKQISMTHERVKAALKPKGASKFVEDAVLYYLDAKDNEYISNEFISKEQIERMVMDCIKNSNYTQEIHKLVEDINFIIREQKNKPQNE